MPLTPEQIKNWRRVMSVMRGPYALIMPDEEVQALRDKFQELIDDLEEATDATD